MISTHLDGQLDLGYQIPDEKILELADAPIAPSIRINSNATKALLLYRNQFKTINELSEQEMRLAGLRINPKTARITNIVWSPDQSKVAFTNTVLNGVELWYFSLDEHVAKKLSDANLNANMGDAINWMKDNNSLLITKLPKDKSSLIDVNNSIPKGPTVSVNDGGKKAQNRTYQDLLKNPNDEKNFQQLAKSEIWKVNLDGEETLWKPAEMFSNITISPDGNYIMVQTIHEPFSYLVPYYRFPSKTTVYTADGSLVKVVLEVPLIEDLPKGFMAVRKGMRNVNWRADKPSTLYWVEALDDGDPESKVEYRDAVYQQDVPFSNEKSLLLKTKERYNGIQWGTDDFAICYNYWWNSRNLRTEFFNPSNPDQEVKLFSERNYQDRYSDPGDFVTKRNKFGRSVLDIAQGKLHLLGEGYSDEGKFPFVDVLDIQTNETNRLFHATDETKLENLIAGIDMVNNKVLTRLESKNEYPNYFFRNVSTGELKQITDFQNPFKAIQDVHKEVIKYNRDDGLELSATLYLPVGYDKSYKEKMPMILWAYPREYKDKGSAGREKKSQTIRSALS